ncbi:MAG: ABC transporter permease [Clostridiales Family XIII bacterium]|jgi:ribose transport system permease protein|nr:ABC transporter permease [Clostridiales Family XIII bacterium]
MDQQAGRSNAFSNLLRMDQSALLIALFVICGILSFLSPVFFSSNNIMNILRQASPNLIAATGMALIILSGEIDLSVGSLQAFAGVLGVMAMNRTGSIFMGVVVTLAVGCGAGFFNGFLVTKLKLNSLIATLGTMAIFRGVIMVITQAVSQPIRVKGFSEIGMGSIGIFPIPLLIAILLILFFYFVLNNTIFGRYIYAVGGNKDASTLAGLSVTRIKLMVFVVGNILFAVSAVILTSRLDSGQPIAGSGMEMTVIAAVILGGVSLSGGSGSLIGAIIGVLILNVLQNGLVLMDVNTFYHDIVRGVVIIVAVYLDVQRKASAEIRLLKESQAMLK